MGIEASRREQVRSLLAPQRSTPAARQPSDAVGLPTAVGVHGAAAVTKVLTRPAWLLFHVLAAALAVTFVLLSRW